MAITFVAASTGSSASSGSFSVTKPTGTTSGDVLIVFGASNEGAWDTLPSGFTQFAVTTDGDTPNLFRTYGWYKVCGGSEPSSYSFGSTTAAGAGAPMVAAISCWRGVDTSNPVPDSSIVSDGAWVTEPANPATSFTSSAPGRWIFSRAVRTANSTSPSFSTSNTHWDERADIGRNSGGSVSYGLAVYSYESDLPESTAAAEPAVTCSTTETDNAYILVNLKVLGDPSSGDVAMQLGSVTETFAATREIPTGDIGVSLGHVAMDFVGTAAPPSGSMAMQLNSVSEDFAGVSAASGGFAMQLSPVAADFAGQIINGSFAMQLNPVTEAFAGSVNPIGGFSLQLSPITMQLASETVPFGEHVIHVEAEGRAFRVIDEDPGLIPIKRGQVWKQHVNARMDVDLGGVTMAFEGGQPVTGSTALQLSPVTIAFASQLEDLLKYVTSIGDGSNTSYTVTHSAGTKDVSVAVYENASPYEEVVPRITHTTTSAVTLEFTTAPTTNQYRVLVLWSII